MSDYDRDGSPMNQLWQPLERKTILGEEILFEKLLDCGWKRRDFGLWDPNTPIVGGMLDDYLNEGAIVDGYWFP